MSTNNDALFTPATRALGTSEQLAGSSFQLKIEQIDADILTAAQVPLFQCTVTVPTWIPNQVIPEEVYGLIEVYQDRGFGTKYDGDVGTLTVLWYNPRMFYQDIQTVNHPSPDKIPLLGFDFPAYLLYLYQTSGVDLRSTTSNLSTRAINRAINDAATQGQTSVTLRTMNDIMIIDVRASVLTVLYADVLQMLSNSGYTAHFQDGVGLVVDWSAASGISGFQAYHGESSGVNTLA